MPLAEQKKYVSSEKTMKEKNTGLKINALVLFKKTHQRPFTITALEQKILICAQKNVEFFSN